MSGWLVVFAKVPRPGGVKTRMCPPLDWETAARLYEAMLGDVLAESERAAAQAGLALVVAAESAEGAALLSRRGPPSAPFIAQVGSGLAARMAHVAGSARSAGAEILLIRGSDSPSLSRQLICDAADRVASSTPTRPEPQPDPGVQVALSPDPDGGYNLVALSQKALRDGFSGGFDLFDHAMSTARVLAETRARAEAAGLRTALLEPSCDVDCVEDLGYLARWRGAPSESPCPATLAFVEQHALWPGARPASSPSNP